MISAERVEELLMRLPQLTIGLLGDLFLDQYLEISSHLKEDSIETGLESYQVDAVRNSPGALGTVAKNLTSLGVGSVKPLTVIGDDGRGADLVRCLESWGIQTDWVVREAGRLTPTYTKPMQHHADARPPSELNRIDIRSRGPIRRETSEKLATILDRHFDDCDGWIVLDQVNEIGWGVIDDNVIHALQRQTSAAPEKFVLVDSRQRLADFANTVLKGNDHEITVAVGVPRAEDAASELARRTGHPVICTCGAEGIWIGQPDGPSVRSAGRRVPDPIDIVGAGDMVSAALTAIHLAGGSLLEGAECANLAASIAIRMLGTTGEASPKELLAGANA
jgi:bifunctional ADP-heptose synthase (sugar kinase/adenylyltransferase)